MKTIALLCTGGTIACRKTANGLAPALDAAALAACLTGHADVRLVPLDVFSMDSSNIQPEEWSRLAEAVFNALQTADGALITHGTDTMGYTAAALSFMLLGIEKPVVLTGSQLPQGVPLSDAEVNLSCALEAVIRAADEGRGGVYVCFNHKLIRGTRAVKTRTMSFDAFDSVNAPLAGVIDSEGVRFLQPIRKPGHTCALRNQVDSRVFLLKLIPGTQPDILDFIAQAGYRGLVIEAFGLGGLHYIRRNLVEKLRALREAGVLVLVVTQCMYEKANLSIYEVGTQLLKANVISGRDMTTEAAVTKLMWALASDDPEGVLQKNLCGEMRGEN